MTALLGNPVTFLTVSEWIIGRRSFDVLDALVAVLRAHPEITLVDLQSHTDDRGERATNRRVEAHIQSARSRGTQPR